MNVIWIFNIFLIIALMIMLSAVVEDNKKQIRLLDERLNNVEMAK